MAEYIDKDFVLDFIDEYADENKMYLTELYRYIEGMPAENVVPVVRCKDCENAYVPDVLKDLLGENKYCQEKKRVVPCNGYCHIGKRRGEIKHEKISD